MRSWRSSYLYRVQTAEGSMEDAVAFARFSSSRLYAVQTEPQTRSMHALHPTHNLHLYRVQNDEGASS